MKGKVEVGAAKIVYFIGGKYMHVGKADFVIGLC